MRTVGCLTTFGSLDPSYSLCAVVTQQLRGLVQYGYKPILFVLPSFKDDALVPVGVEIRKTVPQLILEPYRDGGVSPTFEEDAQQVFLAFEKTLADVDLVIAHDLHFQEAFVAYNKAIRMYAERNPRLRWLHFTHSAPSPWQSVPYPHSLRYEMMPNAKIVYLNHTDHIRTVEMYKGAELDDVVVVPNPMDARHFLVTHPFVKRLLDTYPSILDADVLTVYPFSTTRMAAKGVGKVLKLLSKMHKRGIKVCFIAANAHANGTREKAAVAGMQAIAMKEGLPAESCIFTSFEEVPTWEHGIPPEAVRDLFLLSNVFFLPSDSENCSLTLLEAALTKNLCVLNKSFRPMADQLGVHAMYFDFGALGSPVTYQDEEKWYDEVAILVCYELSKTKSLEGARTVKQNHSIRHMMKKTLGPLIQKELSEYA